MDKKYIIIPIFLGLVLLALAIPGLYITQEKFFYYWDYGGFQGVAIHQAEDVISQSLTVLKRTIDSINLEYNYFYTIPLIPFILTFGYSRLSYVLSVSLIYQLPFALVVGAIGSLLIQYRRNIVFWSVAFLCLLVPIAWAPTLRGYPDVGGALFIALAVWVFCLDTRLDTWWQSAVIGGLLAAAILYRRHFAYDAIAFFIALSIHGLIYSIRPGIPSESGNTIDQRNALSTVLEQENHNHRCTNKSTWYARIQKNNPPLIKLSSYVMRLGLAGFVCLGVMFLIGKPLLVNIMTTDYGTLFSSYMLPAAQILHFFLSSYGWITWILVGLGFSLGFYTGLLYRPVALFITLFSCISMTLWVLFARQAGIHYTLHVSMFVVLGLAIFGWMAFTLLGDPSRLIILSVFVLFLITNLIVGLDPMRRNSQIESLSGQWFSTTYAPLIRSDYEEVVHLVAYLRSFTTEGDVIYVVDSSERMNYDLLIKAEEALYDDRKLNMAVTPQIDSRDFYPLELLMQAEYIIITTPLQRHLSNPEEQKVVEVVYKAFIEEWEFSRDFRLLPEKFNLANGAILRIYQRIHSTSTETAVRTLATMKSFIGHRPGKQPDWIVLSSLPSASIKMQRDGITQVSFRRQTFEPTLNQVNVAETGPIFLYVDELEDQVRILGSAECSGQGDPVIPNASNIELSVRILDPSGELIQEKREGLFCSLDKNSFTHDFYFQEPVYLIVSIHRPYQEDACEISIQWSLTR